MNHITLRTFSLIIILVILGIYSNTFLNEFVWDDLFLIVENPSIMLWKYAWVHFAIDLYHSYSNYYRPLQMLTYMVDFSLWRFNTFGYHLTNTFLHIGVSILLLFFIYAITKNKPLSFLGAFFYAIHPVHTASVTYIAGRADPLVTLFMLAALIFFHYHFSGPTRFYARLCYGASLLFFILALLSKEVAVMLPAIILVHAYLVVDKDDVVRSGRYIPFHFISPFIVVLGVYLVLRSNALNFQQGVVIFHGHGVYERLLTSVKAIAKYFEVIFFPLQLHMERNIPYAQSFFEQAVLISMVVILMVVWLVVRVSRFSKIALYGFLFFAITLLPVMNIYPLTNNMAEHWLYTPMVGMSILVASLSVNIWNSRKGIRPILITIFLLYVVFFCCRTFLRNFDWRDRFTIYSQTLQHNPRSIKMLNNIGNLFQASGDMSMALLYHTAAAEIAPGEYRTRLNLGLDYEKMGKLKEALKQYRLSKYFKHNYAKAYYNMGNVFEKLGKYDMAIDSYVRAIRNDRFHIGARLHLGNVYYELGYLQTAKEVYEELIEVNPSVHEAYNNLGNTLSLLGEHDAAIAAHMKAISIYGLKEAKYPADLGLSYARAGMYEEALEALKLAHSLDPRDIETIINIGATYYYMGDNASAKREWGKVLILDPDNSTAKTYLQLIPPE